MVTVKIENIKNAVRQALRDFIKKDSVLLDSFCSERSVCHKYAINLSLQHCFKGFSIDCEYNRNGVRPKTLGNSYRKAFPDIVVHNRGSHGVNLLVIELKMASRVRSKTIARDEEKLRGYLDELNYLLGLSLIVPERENGTFILKWFYSNMIQEVTIEKFHGRNELLSSQFNKAL